MPGPLPDPNRRRRNAPTIPTTNLPAKGRRGAAPKPPVGYDLCERGVAWWRWAWKTPQAAGWSKGDLYLVARRAQLEDDLGVLQRVNAGLDLDELLEQSPVAGALSLKWIMERLKSLATNDLAVKREAREIDDRLGLTPKGMAALRWKIVDDEGGERGASVRRLRPVPSASSGADPRRLLEG